VKKLLVLIGLAPLFVLTFTAMGNDLIPYRLGNKWGYCDNLKKMVIAPQYFDAKPFSEGLAVVGRGSMAGIQFGYIDKTGKEVIPLALTSADSFHLGLARVSDLKVSDRYRRWYIDPQARIGFFFMFSASSE
jgi:hypothetical protein